MQEEKFEPGRDFAVAIGAGIRYASAPRAAGDRKSGGFRFGFRHFNRTP